MNTQIGSATFDGKRGIELVQNPPLTKSTAYTEAKKQVASTAKHVLSRRSLREQ